jgi:hypothetical protein
VILDWGLFNRNAKFFLLRDKLLFSDSPGIYYNAIWVNFFLRFSFVFSISQGMIIRFGPCFPLFIGALEAFRRSVWNFFRLENEQIII